MIKNDLKKIANKLNIELKGDIKKFIYIVCKKFLECQNIFDKEVWLRNFLRFYSEVKDIKIDEKIDNPEDICWLYQYFISNEKTRVFKNLQNNIKVEKEDIPFATQLFTPEWIVKYLVQNTLGRFIDNKEKFEYYVKTKDKDITENKSLEEQFRDSLKLQGYTNNDQSLIKLLDTGFLDSQVIKNMRLSANGFYEQ